MFGSVRLAKHNPTGVWIALKCLHKKEIIRLKQVMPRPCWQTQKQHGFLASRTHLSVAMQHRVAGAVCTDGKGDHAKFESPIHRAHGRELPGRQPSLPDR